MTSFRKIVFSLVVVTLWLSGEKARGVNSQNKVFVYCQAKYRSEADLVIKPSGKQNSQICIFISKYCSASVGKVWFDNYSKTEAYLSRSQNSCI